MTSKIFSQLTNGSSVSFNTANDILILDTASAAGYTVGTSAAGTSFTAGGKTITLSHVALGALTSSNVSVPGGSVVVVGDNTTATDLDDLAQGAGGVLVTVPGSGNDLIYGLGGSDVINGQDGADIIFGNAGNDTITEDANEAAGDVIHAGADNDVIDGSAANEGFTAYGDNGSDTITGGTGSDTINGNAGNDSIVAAAGAAGTDIIHGGAGDDVISYSANVITGGSVLIEGDLGNDTLTAGAGATYTINGGAGADSIIGAAGVDLINGNAGNDTIGDAAGADTVHGGADNDSITLSVADTTADLVYGDKGNDTIVVAAGNSGADTIFGGEGTDSIDISAATTTGITVSGDAGADTIKISANGTTIGAHTVSGGAGADTFQVWLDGGATTDVSTITDFGLGADTLSLTNDALNAAGMENQLTSSTLILENGNTGTIGNDERVVITLASASGTINVTNNTSSATSLVLYNTGTTGATLTGGAGNDLVLSLYGDDSISAGSGADSISSGDGNDTILGGDGADTILAGAGNDSIDAGTDASADSIVAGAGNDTVAIADDAVLVVDGGTGTNEIDITGAASETFAFADAGIEGFNTVKLGGTGAITLTFAEYTASGTDIAAGDTVTIIASTVTSGTLTITDSQETNVHFNVTGTGGADVITLDSSDAYGHTVSGGDGADAITGGGSADSLIGGADNDTLLGAEGVDTITTGTGSDTVTLDYSNVGTEADTITDFNASGTDVIALDMSALETAGTSGVNANASDFVILAASTSVADTDAIVVQDLTATAAAGAGATVFNLVGATFANTDAVETALEAGGSFALTGLNAAVAQYDSFVVTYSDGVDAHVAIATFVANPGATISALDLHVVNIATLSGNAAITAGEFVAGNFDWIA